MKPIRVSIASGLAAAVILIGGVASAQSAAFSSEMGVGTQGNEVTSLQTWLENNGYYSGPVTGYYGSLTEAAVEQFQSANGISATGYVGPLTLSALNAKATASTTTGANATELAQLQAELSSLLAQIQTLEGGSSSSSSTGIPTASNMSFQTNEGTVANGTITASGTGPFTYTIKTYPTNGSITSFNTQTGAFTYSPNANFTGNDTFTYTVGNSSGTSAPMTATIDVMSTSNTSTTSTSTPTGQTLSLNTANGAALNGTLTASGSGPYTYQIATNPTSGTIINFSPTVGSFTYIPNAGYTGTDSFTYVVGNSTGTSSPYTVNITD